MSSTMYFEATYEINSQTKPYNHLPSVLELHCKSESVHLITNELGNKFEALFPEYIFRVLYMKLIKEGYSYVN